MSEKSTTKTPEVEDSSELVHPGREGFKEKVTPKDPEGLLFLFTCPTKGCGSIHFRHAGYVEIMVPRLLPGNEKSVPTVSEAVKICVKCKSAFIWVNEQVYDVTSKIDLEAWEKTELEAHKMTGPGGQC